MIVFSNKDFDLPIKQAMIKKYLHEISSAFPTMGIIQGKQGENNTKWVGGSPPEHGWVTLNTDGSCRGNIKLAGGGGLLRDHTGKWITGFSINLGHCIALVAELWAILRGLRIAWEAGVRKLVLETDSLTAYRGLASLSQGGQPSWSLI